MYPMPNGGRFVTLEGPEGSGKTSVCREIVGEFSTMKLLVVREPGSTSLGEKIRTLLQTENMPARAELMLFEAARACIVDTVIIPQLTSGGYVLCDRFFDSTTAYQGYGRGFDLDVVRDMNLFATEDLEPDLTIVFDIDPEVGMARKGKATDRIEAAGVDFHKRVREGYLAMAKRDPDRLKIVDASRSLKEVVADVCCILRVTAGWTGC